MPGSLARWRAFRARPLNIARDRPPGNDADPAHPSAASDGSGELVGSGRIQTRVRGLDLDTGSLAAVKQIALAPGTPADSPARTQRRRPRQLGRGRRGAREIETEVALMRRLKHPNVVGYIGTERAEDGTLHIFMEYVPGGSVHSLLRRFGSFSETVIRVYTRQILAGLEYLHRHQIMHRDIKGANVLVDNSGVIKLADFGASKRLAEMVTTEGGHRSIKGTPYWMAPEVIKQTGHGRQADIWSVGCTVLEMGHGKTPWSEHGSQVSALFHIASSKSPPIPEWMSPEGKDSPPLPCFNRVRRRTGPTRHDCFDILSRSSHRPRCRRRPTPFDPPRRRPSRPSEETDTQRRPRRARAGDGSPRRSLGRSERRIDRRYPRVRPENTRARVVKDVERVGERRRRVESRG